MLTDRVRAIGAVWLGLTTGCAQCHDHKFDPFTARDFYSLGAFFADIEEPIIGRREDGMLVATPEQEKQLAKLDAELAEASKGLDVAQTKWEAAVVAKQAILPELEPKSTASEADKKTARRVERLRARKRPNASLRNNRRFRRIHQPAPCACGACKWQSDQLKNAPKTRVCS